MSILAVLEQRDGQWNRMSFETLAAAQQWATELGTTASAAVLGRGVEDLAKELASKQLERVIAVEHDLLRHYTPDGYCAALTQAIAQFHPDILLFPHT
jgi:electron transfer flavoprotein alpha subunit